ncbi:MAG: DUF1292 domain-containing protein [Clostridia bacterium]|nr:DUF1292 domain-containing protein [Clostridia bacterium]
MEDTTMEEKEFITLEYNDGTELECEILGIFDLDGKEYIALLPQNDSDEIFLYGYKELEDDEFELIDIDDDEEFEKVAAEFDRLMEEE